MHDTSPTTRLRRWTALATTAATAIAGVLLAGAAPAAAASPYTYRIDMLATGATPMAVAVNHGTHTAYAINGGHRTVSVIDTTTSTVTATVPVGASPSTAAVDPSHNKVYVVNGGENTVSVINGVDNTVTATVPVGTDPQAVAVDSGTGTAYVANYSSATVTVIDTDTDTVIETVTVGRFPNAVTNDPVTHKVYVPNSGAGTVSVIDAATRTVTEVPVGNTPAAVAINPTTRMAYVANVYGGTMSVIDTDTDTVTETVPAGSAPHAVAVNAATNLIYVANPTTDSVTVIDGTTNTVSATLTVGDYPSAITVDQARNTIYVPNRANGTVSVIDGATNTVTSLAVTGVANSASIINPGTVYVPSFTTAGMTVITQAVQTTTTVTASPSPTAGTPATLTAAVSPNPGGGTVAFTDGATPVDGCTAQPVGRATGEATCTVTFPSAGTHSITATYSGRPGYTASTASPLTLTVAPGHAPPAPPAPSSATVSRVAGADRYATAAAASAAKFGNGVADAVVLASGVDYPDALAGVPLATKKHAPLLLTTGATLPEVTRTELRRVLPTGRTVYVLGGTAAIPASISTELTSLGYTVERIGGPNRNATALKVADALGDTATILLASGRDYPDALAAGPAAAHTGGVVLFTNGTALDSATTAYLAAHHGTVYAVGGPAAAARPTATRIVGADRYATANAVAARFFPAPTHTAVASGSGFPDALTGGTLVAGDHGPLLLADTGHTGAATDYLSQARGSIGTCTVLGGIGVVPDQVVDALTTALHAS
jgi:YVTN family beta-propeller protein